MKFNLVLDKINKDFPKVKIAYKDSNKLMKFIATLLFFNKDFMKGYATTLGNTIYLPNEEYATKRPFSVVSLLMHEIYHTQHSASLGFLLYNFLYSSPQIFALLSIPLFFIHWYLGVIALLFLLPIPSIGRAWIEYKAYCVSLYSINKLSKLYNFEPNLEINLKYFMEQFVGGTYYFMWPFKKMLASKFEKVISKIKNGERPFEDKFFDKIDRVMEECHRDDIL